jgi:hypothetical protein
LLDAEDVSSGVRLLGVGVSNLSDAGAEPTHQLRLDLDGFTESSGDRDDRGDRSWRDASRAVDAIRGRYGDSSVGPAILLGPDGVGVKRPGDSQWGPSAGAEPLEPSPGE